MVPLRETLPRKIRANSANAKSLFQMWNPDNIPKHATKRGEIKMEENIASLERERKLDAEVRGRMQLEKARAEWSALDRMQALTPRTLFQDYKPELILEVLLAYLEKHHGFDWAVAWADFDEAQRQRELEGSKKRILAAAEQKKRDEELVKANAEKLRDFDLVLFFDGYRFKDRGGNWHIENHRYLVGKCYEKQCPQTWRIDLAESGWFNKIAEFSGWWMPLHHKHRAREKQQNMDELWVQQMTDEKILFFDKKRGFNGRPAQNLLDEVPLTF